MVVLGVVDEETGRAVEGRQDVRQVGDGLQPAGPGSVLGAVLEEVQSGALVRVFVITFDFLE